MKSVISPDDKNVSKPLYKRHAITPLFRIFHVFIYPLSIAILTRELFLSYNWSTKSRSHCYNVINSN